MYFNYYTHREVAHLKLPQKHTSEMNQLCLTDGEKVSYLRGIDFNRPISDCGAIGTTVDDITSCYMQTKCPYECMKFRIQ